MDKLKAKNSPQSLQYYWYFFIPLTIILSLMVFFPLRIALDELLLDTIFYGAILLFCIISIIRVYRRFHRRSYWLVAVILLCVLLSGWQAFDLIVLRPSFSGPYPGMATYYLPRFPDDTILCHRIIEYYISDTFVTFAYDINRTGSWFACGA